LDFFFLAWIDYPRSGSGHRIQSDLHFLIWDTLKAADIEIPFPQRDLHLRTAPGLERLPALAEALRPPEAPAGNGQEEDSPRPADSPERDPI